MRDLPYAVPRLKLRVQADGRMARWCFLASTRKRVPVHRAQWRETRASQLKLSHRVMRLLHRVPFALAALLLAAALLLTSGWPGLPLALRATTPPEAAPLDVAGLVTSLRPQLVEDHADAVATRDEKDMFRASVAPLQRTLTASGVPTRLSPRPFAAPPAASLAPTSLALRPLAPTVSQLPRPQTLTPSRSAAWWNSSARSAGDELAVSAVRISSDKIMNLAEVQLWGADGLNCALAGTALASSWLQGEFAGRYQPFRINDGVLGDALWHSDVGDTSPWVRITLPDICRATSIVVFGREYLDFASRDEWDQVELLGEDGAIVFRAVIGASGGFTGKPPAWAAGFAGHAASFPSPTPPLRINGAASLVSSLARQESSGCGEVHANRFVVHAPASERVCSARDIFLATRSMSGREARDGRFHIGGCSNIKWVTASEACNALQDIGGLALHGDSLTRHLTQALLVILTGDVAGALNATTTATDEGYHSCACENAFNDGHVPPVLPSAFPTPSPGLPATMPYNTSGAKYCRSKSIARERNLSFWRGRYAQFCPRWDRMYLCYDCDAAGFNCLDCGTSAWGLTYVAGGLWSTKLDDAAFEKYFMRDLNRRRICGLLPAPGLNKPVQYLLSHGKQATLAYNNRISARACQRPDDAHLD